VRQRADIAQRYAERVKDVSFPRGIGIEHRRAGFPGARTEARRDRLVERLDRHPFLVETDDLAELRFIRRRKAHPVAELHESRESRDAAERRGHLCDGAPDLDERLCRGSGRDAVGEQRKPVAGKRVRRQG